MDTHQVASADDLRALIEERDAEYVVVALPAKKNPPKTIKISICVVALFFWGGG